MRPMESIQDLIEEAKVRTVFWALCIFGVTYFLTHTSKSMMMNIPIAILLVSAVRILFNEVDFRWKVRPVPIQSYLSRLKERQLSVNDSRLSNPPPPMKWKRKVGSPTVEAAINDFIDKILKDFVIDLWYSDITPDKEFPEHIRGIILEAIGEISIRAKDLNLMDLLTRDIVDLIGDHIDVFRRNQAIIGRDVMGTLSSEERDERLKYHLMASKELHPALMSAESEYRVLQQLIGGVIAIILKPREAQCPVVRSIARELVTCLVMQPVMNFASPEYINEVIELVFLALKDDSSNFFGGSQSTDGGQHDPSINTHNFRDSDNSSRKFSSSTNQEVDRSLDESCHHKDTSLDFLVLDEFNQPKANDWARVLEAATQRRTEILMPENLENMWSKGRNYKKKEAKRMKGAAQRATPSSWSSPLTTRKPGQELLLSGAGDSIDLNERTLIQVTPGSVVDSPLNHGIDSSNRVEESFPMDGHNKDTLEDGIKFNAEGNRNRLKRSNSTSALQFQTETKKPATEDSGSSIITEFYRPDFGSHSQEHGTRSASNIVLRSEGPHTPKLKCRVMGAYFEKLGSKSFAVYSIAVTDSEQRTWFVKRRYSNFERLHRHLKDIPNYTLHLPPKRIFSSSTEDAFVHQRCIHLDKYLQDLLSIANVAEQHEVWDFLSASSKSYSFGNSSSVMRTLAVNVDDAVDDIVRQFKGVSNGLMRKVVGSALPSESSSSIPGRHMSWNADEIDRHVFRQSTAETSSSISDNEEVERYRNHGHQEEELSAQANGWHSDNELNSKGFPPRVVKRGEEYKTLTSEEKAISFDWTKHDGYVSANIPTNSVSWADPTGMPPEWSPPNVCVPMLNLVDKIFQLNRRGWLRRQVFWMSKQILQLVMEDAIDDWLLRQIQWLRSEDTVAQGIQWIQDILWPGGTFFIKFGSAMGQGDDDQLSKTILQRAGQFGGGRSSVSKQGSFESQLEAARRASHVKKMLFNGAPTTMVSLIGHKQYKRCARDIYYFLQSTVCIKQLAYGILELLLISVFPELRDLVVDMHKKKRGQQVQ